MLLDCANGIGTKWIKEILKNDKLLEVDLINTSNDPNLLNEGCGAEYVHKE